MSKNSKLKRDRKKKQQGVRERRRRLELGSTWTVHRPLTLQPTSVEPPVTYPTAGPFQAPTGAQSFDDITARIALFSRESLVALGGGILWAIWRDPGLLKASTSLTRDARNVVSIFASRLCALACLYAADTDSAPFAEERHFVLLCWELHNLADGPHKQTELVAIRRRLGAPENETMKRIAALGAEPLRREVVVGRLAALQFGARWHDNSDIFRPLMIAHAYRLALRARFGVAAQERYDDFLGSGVDEYWVNALVLMTLAMLGGSVTLPASGRCIHVAGLFHLSEETISEEIAQATGATIDSVRTTALRISRPLDELGDLRQALEEVPLAERKYAAHADWFLRWPLLDLEVEGAARRLFAASPFYVVSAVQSLLLYDLPAQLVADGVRTADGVPLNLRDVTSLRGEAYASYLWSVLEPHGVVNIDNLGIATETGKRPDFAWCGMHSILFIEAKFTLLPTNARDLSNASAFVASWERTAQALQQIFDFDRRSPSEFLEVAPKKKSKKVAVIVTQDRFPEAIMRFKALAKQARVLESTGFAALAVLSTGDLEYWVDQHSADAFAVECISTWNRLDPRDIINSTLGLSLPTRGNEPLPHIRAAAEQLWPDNPFFATHAEVERS